MVVIREEMLLHLVVRGQDAADPPKMHRTAPATKRHPSPLSVLSTPGLSQLEVLEKGVERRKEKKKKKSFSFLCWRKLIKKGRQGRKAAHNVVCMTPREQSPVSKQQLRGQTIGQAWPKGCSLLGAPTRNPILPLVSPPTHSQGKIRPVPRWGQVGK